MRMPPIVLLLAVCVFLVPTEAQAQATLSLDAFEHPESVAIDSESETVYVSNIGAELAPMAKDGDGFISKVTPNGTVQSLCFLPRDSTEALHAPKGMAIVDGVLYVADIDRIVGFDLDTRARVMVVDVSAFETQFLNDLAVFDGSTLLATATDIGTVFRVPLDEGAAPTVVIEGIGGVNGIHVTPDNMLYLVSFGGNGGIWEMPVDPYANLTGQAAVLSTDGTQLDGIALLPDGRILVSDWTGDDDSEAGALRVFTPGRDSLQSVSLPVSVQGPADFHYDADAERIWIPALPESRVVVLPLRVE